MASTLDGFTYDIFISYRQKDNKGERWVSGFVESLKTELESTFKEEISVYFDTNPHDGLLESHDVMESLREKLKCLVFIPIISRTYCDPKSYAWEHEFRKFVEQASKDQFGLKVKLPNGNVASRVVPVRIHELDIADIGLCEEMLDDPLRSIDFIYRSQGINRPLRPNEEHPQDNLNKSYYRDQINKVANAIDEIIRGLKYYMDKPDKANKVSEAVISHDELKVNKKTNDIKTLINKRSKNWLWWLIAFFTVGASIWAVPKAIDIRKQGRELNSFEKSIAILPFVNDSPNDSNAYFINGIMDEILNNLQKISDLRVLSRTSSEKYRGSTTLTIPEIGRELNVNYLVEGSGQKYGTKFVLRVQLIAVRNEHHMWGHTYTQEIRGTEDIISIQSQVAQTIADELEAKITPEVKEIFEERPTEDLTAFDFYQRGNENLAIYWMNNDRSALKQAESMFNHALKSDGSFARAYTGLALTYYANKYYSTYFSSAYLDSMLILADKALIYDKKLAEAYYIKGIYYNMNNKNDQAIKEFDKALRYNPNYWQVYYWAGRMIYLWDIKYADYLKALKYLHKAVAINRDRYLQDCLRALGDAYGAFAGFPDNSRKCFEEAFRLDNDTVSYYRWLAGLNEWGNNYRKAVELLKKCYQKDSSNFDILTSLGQILQYNGEHMESLYYFRKYIEIAKTTGQFNGGYIHRVAYAYWINGYKKEGYYWFNEHKKICEAAINNGRFYSTTMGSYYDLAGNYAFRGDKEKAYQNLRIFNQLPLYPLWWVRLIKVDPLFSSMHDEPEFKEIVRNMEAKYQAEHDKVQKWLLKTKRL